MTVWQLRLRGSTANGRTNSLFPAKIQRFIRHYQQSVERLLPVEDGYIF